MEGKKKIKLIIALIIIATLSVVIWTIHTNSERAILYEEAISAYEKGSYSTATYKLGDLPEGYQDRDELVSLLNEYSSKYSDALELIDDGEYTQAIEQLSELPSDYYGVQTLIDNMWKIEILLASTWGDSDNYTSNSSWVYLINFKLSTYGTTIRLLICEDEYSETTQGTILMNEYVDSFDIIDLLESNIYYVESDCRDNFTIDITNIENGQYTVKTAYFTITYIIQE